jgi:hypothetical protein
METKVGARLWVPADQAFFDITNRPISDNVLRFSTTASCRSIVIPNWFSRNVTTLSTAMESRIPVVISGVISVNAAESSPGRYSLRMNVFCRSLYILRVHKGFSIRSAGQSLFQLVTAFADTMFAVCSVNQTAAARALRTVCPRAAGDRVQ